MSEDDPTLLMDVSPLPDGTIIQWYRLEGVLGRGGFGITYLGTDTNLDRKVAIKEYLPAQFCYRDKDKQIVPKQQAQAHIVEWGLKSFLAEARTLAKFDHPNLVRVLTSFESHGTAYMVMPFEEGTSLLDLIRDPANQNQAFLESILFPVMDGLELVHSANFIHRDIKPANIYIRQDGTPVLLDFGSARPTDAQETGELTVLISQGYTPTEQYGAEYGKQGPWTDIYAIAATLYVGIVGRSLDDAQSRMKRQQEQSEYDLEVLNSDKYPGFDDTFLKAVARGLEPDPKDRPQSLAEWKRLFKDQSGSMVARAERAPNDMPGRSRLPYAVAGVLALLAAVVGYWQLNVESGEIDSSAVAQTGNSENMLDSPIQSASFLPEMQRLERLTQALGSNVQDAALQSIGERIAGAEHLSEEGAMSTSSALQDIERALMQGNVDFTMGTSPAGRAKAVELCRLADTACSVDSLFADAEDERARRVTITPFDLDRDEVSVEQFAEFVDATGYSTSAQEDGFAYVCCDNNTSLKAADVNWQDASLASESEPYTGQGVRFVSFEDAQRYCEWRGGRLPFESEWEFAVRGGARYEFPWGDDWQGDLHVDKKTGLIPARNTAGGLWEWVIDEETGTGVLKGGSFLHANPAHFRAATRKIIPNNIAENDNGFRCVYPAASWPIDIGRGYGQGA